MSNRLGETGEKAQASSLPTIPLEYKDELALTQESSQV
jgi:hypothetical protein